MSVALENARLFDETQLLLRETERRNAELSVINSIQQGLASKLELQGVIDLVGDKLREVFHSQDLSITWHEEKTNLIHYLYYYEHGVRQKFFTAPPRPDGPYERMVKTHSPLVWNTLAEGDAISPVITGTDASKSGLFIPIISGDRVLGGLQIENYERENAFGEAEMRLLTTITASLGTALENARLFDETQRLLKETETHAAELAVINSVQQGLASKLELQAIIDLVGDKITEIFASDATLISLYEASEKTIHVAYMIEDGRRLQPAPLSLGEGLTSQVIVSKKPLLFGTEEEASQEGAVWTSANPDEPDEKGTQSSLLVPMITGDEVTGVLSVQSYERHAYGESHLRLLSTLAASMSVALQNARLFDETQRLLKETEDRNAELAVINSVQEGLASKLEFQAIIDLIGEKVTEIFNAQATLISLYNPATKEIDHRYLMERGQRLHLDKPVPIDKFRQRVVETRKPWMINQNYEQVVMELGETPVLEGEEPKSLLFVPMIVGEEVTGIISLQNLDTENAFSESDLRLLSTVAASMSVALENARLFKAEQQRAAELAIINSVQAGLASSSRSTTWWATRSAKSSTCRPATS
jgi:GAF domain-containing protein